MVPEGGTVRFVKSDRSRHLYEVALGGATIDVVANADFLRHAELDGRLDVFLRTKSWNRESGRPEQTHVGSKDLARVLARALRMEADRRRVAEGSRL